MKQNDNGLTLLKWVKLHNLFNSITSGESPFRAGCVAMTIAV